MLNQKFNTIGILGGGQLAMFLCKSAKKMDFKVYIYSESINFSAKEFCDKFFVGKFDDEKKIKNFYESVDVVTIETENIPIKTLQSIDNVGKLKPSSKSISITQNRLSEKKFLNSLEGIKTTDFLEINCYGDVLYALKEFKGKLLLKSCEFGYDGKNQYMINTANVAEFKKFRFENFIAEKFVEFEKEISVIITRDNHKNLTFFPPVHNFHEESILRTTEYPANLNSILEKKAVNQATLISKKLDITGIIAIEMFIIKKNQILINELAPRPHNSGHWTIDCCETSQFDNLILAITNNQIHKPNIFSGGLMKNIIGEDYENFNKGKNGIYYDYFKKVVRPKRKMAHCTYKKKIKV